MGCIECKEQIGCIENYWQDGKFKVYRINITLNVNDPNTPIISQKLSDWIKSKTELHAILNLL